MAVVYLHKIKGLKKYENKGVNTILFNIAFSHGLIKNNEIMYRKLYYGVIEPWFKINCNHNMSYKQYSKLRKNYNGKIPKNAACYLFEFYKIMLSLDPPPILERQNNINTYSDYALYFEKNKIEEAIIILGEANIAFGDIIENEFGIFLTSLIDLDERISHVNETKIYNDMW